MIFMLKKGLLLLVVVSLLAAPAFAGAQQGTNQGGIFPQTNQGGISPQTNSGGGFSIENPLRFGSFCQLLKGILGAVVAIGVPVAVIFLVWVGFKFVLARGNSTEIENAKRSFVHTVLGIAIFLGAWIIAQVISATVSQFGVTILSCQ